MSPEVEDGSSVICKSVASRSLWMRSELIMGDSFWVRNPLSLSIRMAVMKVSLDDGISCRKGWGFLRAAINEPVWGVRV